jgi:xanthosine utilization system XapX-like protein
MSCNLSYNTSKQIHAILGATAWLELLSRLYFLPRLAFAQSLQPHSTHNPQAETLEPSRLWHMFALLDTRIPSKPATLVVVFLFGILYGSPKVIQPLARSFFAMKRTLQVQISRPNFLLTIISSISDPASYQNCHGLC